MIRALLTAGSLLFGSQLVNASARLDLGNLGPEWIADTNVMDPIWVPLKLTGVNYFAYGAPVKPNAFAARSDASSPLYQAWFGGYAINGGREVFARGTKVTEFEWFAKFAELDQASWLEAMGDPHPRAKWVRHSKPQAILIDGAKRPMYSAVMVSDSDISEPGEKMTELARKIG